VPALYLERGGRGLLTLVPPDDPALARGLAALAGWVRAEPRRRVAIERIDGEPALTSPLAGAVTEAGWRRDLRTLTLRGGP
jgi:ATP-dependent Lhr-like helicase